MSHPPHSRAAPARSWWPALRNRRFAPFLASMLLSNTGSWTERLALATLVYRTTGFDEAWLALVSFAPALPVFLVSVPAGALTDRMPVRRLVLATQTAMMLASAVMTWAVAAGSVTPAGVVAYALIASALFSIDAPARQALVPRIVPKEHLTNALALNAVAFNSARLLGGIVFYLIVRFTPFGETGCLALNTITYLVPLWVVWRIRETPPPAPADGDGVPPGHALLAGLRFAWQDRTVRGALLVLGVAGIFGWHLSHLFPVYAEKVYGAGRESVGTMQTWFGVGALVGALTLAARAARADLRRTVYRCGFGAAALLWVFALAPSVTWAYPILAACGFLLIQAHAACNAIIQNAVPERLRGRVVALFTLTVLGCFPVGGLLAGFAAKLLGARETTVIAAACFALSLGAIRRLLPRETPVATRGADAV